MDPSMYNGLLLGGEHLIGTPTGEAIAGNVSDLYSVPILAGMGGMLRGAKFCLPTRVTAVKNLTEALGDPKLRALVADVLKGTRSLSELTAEQRQIAADFYRAIAQDTKGSLGEAASKFNELRADFLEGKTTEVPGNIRSFIERHGLPNQ
jgi:hypothetical protein